MKRSAYTSTATERQTQAAIVQYLTVKGICYSITNASIHFENGKPRRRVGTDGWPDVTVCLPGGLFLGIETKSSTGRLRPAQEAMQHKIKAAGGIYLVARCVDDVMRVVERYK